MTLKELAKELDKSYSTIAKWHSQGRIKATRNVYKQGAPFEVDKKEIERLKTMIGEIK